MNAKHIHLQSLWVTLVFAGALSFLSPFSVLHAQDQANPSAQQELEELELVRNNIQPFAGAYKQISRIYTDYEQRILQSSDSDQADALQQEANKKMNQAVADHGLSVKDYNTIFNKIQSDPGLKEEFLIVLQHTR